MKVNDTWIYFPNQCQFCRGYVSPADKKPCAKRETSLLLRDIVELVAKHPDVHLNLDIMCEYFCADNDALETYLRTRDWQTTEQRQINNNQNIKK